MITPKAEYEAYTVAEVMTTPKTQSVIWGKDLDLYLKVLTPHRTKPLSFLHMLPTGF